MKENLRTDTYRTEVYKYFLYTDIYRIGVNYRMVHLPKVNCVSARHVREESNELKSRDKQHKQASRQSRIAVTFNLN